MSRSKMATGIAIVTQAFGVSTREATCWKMVSVSARFHRLGGTCSDSRNQSVQRSRTEVPVLVYILAA
jgi:hypothetical protein